MPPPFIAVSADGALLASGILCLRLLDDTVPAACHRTIAAGANVRYIVCVNTIAPQQDYKSGLAVLVGRTNAGKSTLINALVGTKVAIVTPRPQTTRDTFHGVVNRPEGQIVLVDTPGIFSSASSKLNSALHRKVHKALEGIDVVVHVADPTRAIGKEDEQVLTLLDGVAQPKILVLNKLDVPTRPHREEWLKRRDSYADVLEVSALKALNLESLVQAILRHLPVGPAHYPEGQLSNVTRDFWIAEIIREKLFLKTSQEVPYTATVKLEQVEERQTKNGEPLLYIKAVILTTDDHYRRMLIGREGQKIREIGTAARCELETSLNRKVFLDLEVLVDKHWMDNLG
ncbi:MAG: GTPase Era [Kiritimatiellae bacterium]|nr:GTPase Era [Kiritimatiellia bacterium]